MNLKVLIMKKGITQLTLAKTIGVHPTLLSLQVNMHRLLPEKYLKGFCEAVGISKEDLMKAMNVSGGSNE